ncbi:hypothetical protein [Bacillus sp. S0628]|uniref:hypothetical protein n=1 Tax=Bacillus sp. S0628 TaxID=2957802 RepID=UPI0020A0A533|nr:hypothetical protein [Bacillus sp. S0628]MCP1324253.1 hypothetical protein [Bacillus sp. S0628]
MARWNDEDIKYLLENYGKKTKHEIASHLEKSPNSIVLKANILGLKVEKKYFYKKDYFKVICIDTNNQKQLLSIVDYLYKNSIIYIDRKYEKYKEVHHYLNNKLAYRKRNLTM